MTGTPPAFRITSICSTTPSTIRLVVSAFWRWSVLAPAQKPASNPIDPVSSMSRRAAVQPRLNRWAVSMASAMPMPVSPMPRRIAIVASQSRCSAISSGVPGAMVECSTRAYEGFITTWAAA